MPPAVDVHLRARIQGEVESIAKKQFPVAVAELKKVETHSEPASTIFLVSLSVVAAGVEGRRLSSIVCACTTGRFSASWNAGGNFVVFHALLSDIIRSVHQIV